MCRTMGFSTTMVTYGIGFPAPLSEQASAGILDIKNTVGLTVSLRLFALVPVLPVEDQH